MLKNLIVLPDGTELFSGTGTVNALQSVTLTQQVNAGAELTLGSACSNMLEATIITPAGGLNITPGMDLTLYKVEEDGTRTKMGIFTAEKPVRPSANLYKITAYDRVSWLDKDLTDWLANLDGWPYSLYAFAGMVCQACGVDLANENIPHAGWPVQKFSASYITGRQLMKWVGQACGRFCRATAQGEIELAWYTERNLSLTPDGEIPVVAANMEDYQIAPMDKLQIRLSQSDVGVVYGVGNNAYIITGNYLLTTESALSLQALAKSLYGILSTVAYSPGKVKIPANTEICAGDILSVTDRNGRTVPFYVMSKVQSGPWETLECTGSAYRDSTTVTNNAQFTALNGSVLELKMSMDGLQVENRKGQDKIAAMSLTVDGVVASVFNQQAQLQGATARMAELNLTADGLKTSITEQQTGLQDVTDRMTAMEQTAEGLSLQVQSVKAEGVTKISTATGYTFDEVGLTVEKAGREIKTQITEDGMRVYKNGNAVLTANSEGVDAVDLHASTYLVVGGRSRFENYGADRTGCFWVGG